MPVTAADLGQIDAARDAAFEAGKGGDNTPSAAEVAASGKDEDEILLGGDEGTEGAGEGAGKEGEEGGEGGEEELVLPEESEEEAEGEEALPGGETEEEKVAAAAAAKPAAKPGEAAVKTPEQIAQEQQDEQRLGDLYKTNPKLKEFVQANPGMRPFFFKAVEFNKLYRTVEEATQARGLAQAMYDWDQLYFSDKPEDTRSFLQALHENALDPNGNPRGFYERMAGMVTGDAMSNLSATVERMGPDFALSIGKALGIEKGLTPGQVVFAVKAVMKMFDVLSGEGYETTGAPAGGGAGARAMPGAQPNDEVSRMRSEIARMRELMEGSVQDQFDTSVRTEFRGWLDNQVGGLLAKATSLERQPNTYKAYLFTQIRDGVINAVKSDRLFSSSVMSLARSGNRGPEHRTAIVQALEQRARAYFPEIARSVLSEAGIKLVAKAAAAAAKAGRPTHKEPRTGGTPGRITKPGQGNPNAPKKGETYNQFADRLLLGE